MVRLRKTETDAIKELLDSEWDDESDLIKAIFQKVIDLLEERDCWGVSWGSLAYGPFWDRRHADRIAKEFDNACFSAPVVSVSTLRVAAAKANPASDPKHCSGCGHPKFSHNAVMIRGSERKGCLARGCECPEVYFSKSWEKKSLIAKGAFSGGTFTKDPEEDEDDE